MKNKTKFALSIAGLIINLALIVFVAVLADNKIIITSINPIIPQSMTMPPSRIIYNNKFYLLYYIFLKNSDNFAKKLQKKCNSQ